MPAIQPNFSLAQFPPQTPLSHLITIVFGLAICRLAALLLPCPLNVLFFLVRKISVFPQIWLVLLLSSIFGA
jgi:hypothetical protein